MYKIIKQLTNLLTMDPENIHIYYSNINGKEKFIINDGETEIVEESEDELFDDTEIKNKVSSYKDLVNALDDCVFVDVINDIKTVFDLKTFDELINQTSYTSNEADILEGMIKFTNTVIYEHLQNKISNYKELLERI